MMRKVLGGVLIAVLTLTSASALAQGSAKKRRNQPTTTQPSRSDDCAKQRRQNNGQCTITIDEGEDVTGDRVGNGDETIIVRPGQDKPRPLIRHRTDMTDKIVQSGEQIS